VAVLRFGATVIRSPFLGDGQYVGMARSVLFLLGAGGPRRAGPGDEARIRAMNVKHTIAAIRKLGLSAERIGGEWRINYRNSHKGMAGFCTAYYTTDNDDALDTARAMAVRMAKKPKHWPNRRDRRKQRQQLSLSLQSSKRPGRREITARPTEQSAGAASADR
jgi:hypothetical protein